MPSIQTQLEGLIRRQTPNASYTDTSLGNIQIVGIVIAVLMVLAAATWLGIRYVRRHRAKKAENAREAAFINIRGVVKDHPTNEKFERPQLSVNTSGFSRNQLDAGTITMPERTLGSSRANEEIINFHRRSGTLPKAFNISRDTPPSSPLSSLHPPSIHVPGLSPVGDRGSWIRHSFLSATSGAFSNRYSVSSSGASSFAEATSGTVRKVKQVFTPVLPDELLLTRIGEQLRVVQSFDDGWCVVGREDGSGFYQKKSLFKTTPESEEKNVELGVVPAWCFLKPVKGLRAERPMRVSSLGVTVQVEAEASREMIYSWSNF